MKTAICLVFPQQLFELHPALVEASEFWLIEDELFFNQYAFHRKKLAFHRASMSYYAEKLRSKGKVVHYFKQKSVTLRQVFEKLQQKNALVHLIDPTDYLLERRIKRFAAQFELELTWYDNPSFFNTRDVNDQLLGSASKRFLMADFYKKQRSRLGVLLTKEGQPMGGRWSFDTENRKALPKNMALPSFPVYQSEWSGKSQEEILMEFPEHKGDPNLAFYPVTHEEARAALTFFVSTNLSNFGPYQDAFSTEAPYVFHSNLSTALNVGLLTPQQVLEHVLEQYHNGKVTIESAEGFIRQLIGWREFVRAVYERTGVAQRTTNAMKHERTMDWQQISALSIMKQTSSKLEHYAYAHHIERLMLLGNFFFLAEINPDHVYRFFMENFMDAYDWVMVPNVYGMSQYADGGLMTTKPYFSGSNYLKKQGFQIDKEGMALFDALFWHFVDKHQERLRKNLRTVQMVANWNRMLPEKKTAHLERAASYFEKGY
ncbi:MAG: cryptochrome/photolyase family protein [Flavobacteriales bacterium]